MKRCLMVLLAVVMFTPFTLISSKATAFSDIRAGKLIEARFLPRNEATSDTLAEFYCQAVLKRPTGDLVTIHVKSSFAYHDLLCNTLFNAVDSSVTIKSRTSIYDRACAKAS